LPPPVPPAASFSSLSPVHVIKKCSHLEAPAIFFSFKDCQFYLNLQDDEEEEEGENGEDDDDKKEPLENAWEYDLFDTVEEALALLRNGETQPPSLPSSSSSSSSSPRPQNQDEDSQNDDDDDDDDDDNESFEPQPDTIIRFGPETQPGTIIRIVQNQKRKRKEEEDDYETKKLRRALELERLYTQRRHIKIFEKYFALLQQFKQDYGDCDVPYSKREFDTADNTTTAANNVDCDGGGATSVTYTYDTDPTSTRATSSSHAPPLPPPRINIDWEKYEGLGGWVSRTRSYIVMHQNEATRGSCILTDEQMQRLFNLGFVMEPRRNKPPNKLPPQCLPPYDEVVIQRVKGNRRASQNRRHMRFEDYLAWLRQFKQDYGDCDVPFKKRDYSFGEYVQKGDCDFLDNTTTENGGGGASQVATTAADMGGGEDDGGGNSGTDTGEIDPISTTATSSPTALPPPPPPPRSKNIDWEKYDGLGGWVSRMRHQIEKYQKVATRKSSYLTEEQVQRLLDVGFVMVPRRNKPIRARDRVRKNA
jgi:hypothetical protein